MGGSRTSKSIRSKRKHLEETSSSSSPSSSGSDSERSPEKRYSSHRHREDRHKGVNGSKKEKEKNESVGKSRNRKGRQDRKGKKKRDLKRRSRREDKRRLAKTNDTESSDDDHSEPSKSRNKPETVLRYILKRFLNVGDDLKQLLQMIDDGQAVDTRGISNRSLVKHLKKLFLSLNLKENDDGVFLLPPKVCPTLEVVGPMICLHLRPKDQQFSNSASANGMESIPLDADSKKMIDDNQLTKDDASAPKRRVIGPEMPSSELLAAAAKLTEAESLLREAELENDNEIFIGPPPPAVVAEAESANDAERFEEVTRIMEVEVDSPYDVLGVNHNMSTDNIKKRYWKLSLMVHPDKCSHPQANQAFIKLNKAFKDLQDPDKRKVLDEKIRLKEEQEELKAELKACREAAQWRRLQGISMPGDDELLAEMELPPKRDDWMTTLPPERKPGMTTSMQSTTSFSRNSKEGRGDTSIWTDTPLDRAQKAKINYLEAYNEAAALASNDEDRKQTNYADADLVDKYNLSNRSKSLVQKHQEKAAGSRPKKKSKQQSEKEQWVGQHPWKPWDRENDLTAGRQKINLDSENMTQGLTSRFSSGTIQRNFL